ncbi:unnamed protein product [Pleuronectes platessa]|uniref:Uncharacterized protein n=1 Tax=Pleuronectes platessa TaxID=8262 RepID=A0A9N7UN90_PLEPL|nr:unnamed protein product [Pleuronectes platessa]
MDNKKRNNKRKRKRRKKDKKTEDFYKWEQQQEKVEQERNEKYNMKKIRKEEEAQEKQVPATGWRPLFDLWTLRGPEASHLNHECRADPGSVRSLSSSHQDLSSECERRPNPQTQPRVHRSPELHPLHCSILFKHTCHHLNELFSDQTRDSLR